ncbi:protein neprosin-like [Bidens hawaiensis]|uniref:protein neprosin-like n=1 Tax=Bidens hawaiensis TaxID=980011 RepID=UPI00404ABAFB
MKYQATSVQWGGEVYSLKVGAHPHTQTTIGNGEFSNRLSRRCGTITWMLIESNSNPPMRPDSDTLFISSDEWSCYDAYLLTRRVPEPVFFYGVVISKKTNIPKRRAIKTIRVKDGDVVDCVDIYKQLAFEHPVLKNHAIQTLGKSSSSKAPSQLWIQYGSCPNGTIPIRARANIKVWTPYVELTGDYSSSQVMLWGNPPVSRFNEYETVQAGWAVHPTLYCDTKTHLFVAWSLDGKKKTGCFDHTCPGFVQTSPAIMLGGDIGTYNNGTEMTFQISKWFIYNDNEVGYWPSELFKLLKNHSSMVQWGGEVYSSRVGTHPHTATAMGSGHFADRVNRQSGLITGMLVEVDSYPLKRPGAFTTSSNEWSCYDADLLDEDVPEPVLLYGGPGSRNNPNC